MLGELAVERTFTGAGKLIPIEAPKWKEPRLDPGAKMDIPLSDCLIVPNEQLSGVYVGLLVTYHPLPFPIERRLTTTYTAINEGYGHFHWYSGPEH